VNFEAYLASKKIDSTAFRNAEPAVWNSWNDVFAQMHPNSFTLQKLNLINSVRRKYLLKEQTPVVPIVKITTTEISPEPVTAPTTPPPTTPGAPPAAAAAKKPARPVMRPKPKIG
jgi:hypothetical protein